MVDLPLGQWVIHLWTGIAWERAGDCYLCKNNHLGRVGQPIDEMVEAVVLGVLSETDIGKRLTKQQPGIDTVTLRVKREMLVARKDGLATLFADGVLDGPGELRRHWEAASPDIRGKVLDELMTVTVKPTTARGRTEFDPSLVLIEPKVTQS